ncbi:putative ribosome biogenesis GTPase RsgA [Synergistales bacterium]|nr:putative ribosome biogenesis GTPase RsgA [Synergistales bacterium]
MKKIDLKNWGFGDIFSEEAGLYPDCFVGRVVSQSKNLYMAICENGAVIAEVSGKFRFDAKTLSDFPAVGDFVMLDRNENENGNAVIRRVLSRKSAFVRKSAGASGEEQIVASNIDTVFICMSLNNDFNLRRLERYLSVAWASGAVPVVVLTKSDLCGDIELKLREAYSVAAGVSILVASAMSEDGYSRIASYLKAGETVALIGSSGVGKSTLINRLLGENRFDTQELRNDDRGRHTTTMRELILLPCGAMVIDTPGMRELGLESADLSKSFADIDELTGRCKFKNCSHTIEPGCAVKRAIEEGVLPEKRFANYLKLCRELAYEGLNSRQTEQAKIDRMFGGKKKMKQVFKDIKARNR